MSGISKLERHGKHGPWVVRDIWAEWCELWIQIGIARMLVVGKDMPLKWAAITMGYGALFDK